MMKKLNKTIVMYESIGFAVVICLLWVDEILDLPHKVFMAKATPINWVESAMETIAVLFLAAIVIFFTIKALKEIKYLEGFLPVCSFCKKIRVDEKTWIPIETFIAHNTEAVLSHGYCPECAKKYYDFDTDEEIDNTGNKKGTSIS